MSIIDYPWGPFNEQFFPWFYVGAYNAKGDGIADDAPAINAAIAAAASNGPQGGTVLLGPFHYLVNSMVVNNFPNVNILGMGEGTSALVQGFAPSAENPAILMHGPNATSCTYTSFSLVGPGSSATGSVPGPSTSDAPQLGTGWGFLNFGGNQCQLSYVSTAGCFHGFGAIIFGTTSFDNCEAGMGGIQQQTQYGFYAQGPEGSAATGTITINTSPAPQQGDTITGVFDDGQGNVITVPPYTVTATNAGAPTPADAVAVSYSQWLNNSDIVVGPLGNWSNCLPSGNTVALSIDVPSDATTPTYSVSSTGTTVVAPTTTTPVVGGSRNKNPVSQVFQVRSCQVAQAEFNSGGTSFASTEGVHIDGAVTTAGIRQFGTTGVKYGVRFANVNSGSDRDPQGIAINGASFDHSHFSSISHESGAPVTIDDVDIIANFGGGPPPTSFAINIADTAGGALISNVRISECDSGGIGIGNGGVYIDNVRIVQVGRQFLSGITFFGSNAIVGVTIKNSKIGAPNLATGGNGTNAYAIDLMGPGGGTSFTGTVQSLTIQDCDVTGVAGAINTGTVISSALSTFGLAAYNTIQHNAGYDPVLGVTQPTPPTAGVPTAPVLNPFAADCSVWIQPAGGATVTMISILSNDGAITQTVSYTAGFNVQVPANTSIQLSFSSGTVTWNWWPA